MLKFKSQPAAHVTPEFTSSEWIAHNAAMRAKRDLLGHGKRPVIGSAWWPKPVVTPAVFMSPARPPRLAIIRDVAMITAAVLALCLVAFAGVAAGLK